MCKRSNRNVKVNLATGYDSNTSLAGILSGERVLYFSSGVIQDAGWPNTFANILFSPKTADFTPEASG